MTQKISKSEAMKEYRRKKSEVCPHGEFIGIGAYCGLCNLDSDSDGDPAPSISELYYADGCLKGFPKAYCPEHGSLGKSETSQGARAAARQLDRGGPCHDDRCPNAKQHRDKYEEEMAMIIERHTLVGEITRQRDAAVAALRGIIDIGKRDMSNPKYDSYFESAHELLKQVEQGVIGKAKPQ